MEPVTIKQVIRALKLSDDQYYQDVAYLKDMIDTDLDLLALAIRENNLEDIRIHKHNINKSRQKLMELEYYPLKSKNKEFALT